VLVVDDILKRWGITLTEQLVNDIKTKLIQRLGVSGSFSSPVNASGQLADSIKYTIDGYRLKIQGNDYIYYLQNGRKAGGRPPIKVIRQWIDDKGILPNKGSKDSLAWAIAKKIEEEGTTIWKAGGSDLVSGIFNEALQQSIEADFANLIASEISSEIINIAA
jgi:hypothetical protein